MAESSSLVLKIVNEGSYDSCQEISVTRYHSKVRKKILLSIWGLSPLHIWGLIKGEVFLVFHIKLRKLLDLKQLLSSLPSVISETFLRKC